MFLYHKNATNNINIKTNYFRMLNASFKIKKKNLPIRSSKFAIKALNLIIGQFFDIKNNIICIKYISSYCARCEFSICNLLTNNTIIFYIVSPKSIKKAFFVNWGIFFLLFIDKLIKTLSRTTLYMHNV